MKYTIVFTREAIEDLKAFNARQKKNLLDAIETHLRHEPEKASKSRIKRLNNLEWPQYRLRVEKTRVFFDVEANLVMIIAIMPKERCQEWLEKYGKTTKED
jgi:mRNA-degrading endonuclease RelE of RelBE toxin-antitoxin system